MTQTTENFRPLSHEEIEQAMEEWQYYLAWQEVCHFAWKHYGKRAYKVRFDYQSEYDDEGGTYFYVQNTTVYDQEEKELSYNFTTPFWHERLEEIDKKLRTELGEQQFTRLSTGELQHLRSKIIDDNYMVDMTELKQLNKFITENHYAAELFEFEKPPRLTFPALYVLR